MGPMNSKQQTLPASGSKPMRTRSPEKFSGALFAAIPVSGFDFVRSGEAVVISAVSLRSSNEKCRMQQELKT